MAEIKAMEQVANRARQNIIEMIYEAQSGHLGGSLSIVEILTILYFNVMKLDPKNPNWEDRDRFILSKGHAAPALYVFLMMKGYFGMENLHTLRRFQSLLQGHPDMKKTPGVDYTTGSLGNGLGVGNGMALAAKLSGKTYHTFVLVGDGELQEGTFWESAMTTVAQKLSNLTIIVDKNELQVEGRVDQIKHLDNMCGRFESFGFDAYEVDGHDMKALADLFSQTKESHGGPTAIIANTVKGKGVSFAENQVNWHKGELDAVLYKEASKELAKEADIICKKLLETHSTNV